MSSPTTPIASQSIIRSFHHSINQLIPRAYVRLTWRWLNTVQLSLLGQKGPKIPVIWLLSVLLSYGLFRLFQASRQRRIQSKHQRNLELYWSKFDDRIRFGFDIGGTLCKLVYFEPTKVRLEDQAIKERVDQYIKSSIHYGETGNRDTALELSCPSVSCPSVNGTFHFVKFQTSQMVNFVKIVQQHRLAPVTTGLNNLMNNNFLGNSSNAPLSSNLSNNQFQVPGDALYSQATTHSSVDSINQSLSQSLSHPPRRLSIPTSPALTSSSAAVLSFSTAPSTRSSNPSSNVRPKLGATGWYTLTDPASPPFSGVKSPVHQSVNSSNQSFLHTMNQSNNHFSLPGSRTFGPQISARISSAPNSSATLTDAVKSFETAHQLNNQLINQCLKSSLSNQAIDSLTNNRISRSSQHSVQFDVQSSIHLNGHLDDSTSLPDSNGHTIALTNDRLDDQLTNHSTNPAPIQPLHNITDVAKKVIKHNFFTRAQAMLHTVYTECISFLPQLTNPSFNQSMHPALPPPTVCGTGGGAYKFSSLFARELNVNLHVSDELESLVKGIDYLLHTCPDECYHLSSFLFKEPLQRKTSPPVHYPYLVCNIGSGVSILKVSGPQQFERVGGTSLGGGTFLGLCKAMTGCTSFEEALDLASRGHSSKADLLVGDIYGGDYAQCGLAAENVAASFGKLSRFSQTHPSCSPADLCKAALVMITNNIGSLVNLYAHQVLHVPQMVFVGNFLTHNEIAKRGLAFATDYWSHGTAQAIFLKHEGYFGAVGAMCD